jgi:hypothetical protein
MSQPLPRKYTHGIVILSSSATEFIKLTHERPNIPYKELPNECYCNLICWSTLNTEGVNFGLYLAD